MCNGNRLLTTKSLLASKISQNRYNVALLGYYLFKLESYLTMITNKHTVELKV